MHRFAFFTFHRRAHRRRGAGVASLAAAVALSVAASSFTHAQEPAADSAANTAQPAAEQPPPAEKLVLRHRLAADQSLRYRFTGHTTATADLGLGQAPMTAISGAETTFRLRAQSVGPDSTTLGIAIHALGFHYRDAQTRVAFRLGENLGADGGYAAVSEVDGESRKLPELDLWPGADWSTTKPPTLGEDIVTAHLPPTGGLQRITTKIPATGKTLVTYQNPSVLASLVLIPLPEGPVEVGSEWTATVPAPPQFGQPTAELTLACKVVAIDTDGEWRRVRAEFTVTSAALGGLIAAAGSVQFVASTDDKRGEVERIAYTFTTRESLGDVQLTSQTTYTFARLADTTPR